MYPAGGWRRWFFRGPLLLWRLGLGWMLGRYLLLLTHTGRRSGRPRRAVLEHTDFDGFLHIASGWAGRPQWVNNIEANPLVTVQCGRRTFGARVRRLSSESDLAHLFESARGRSPVWSEWLQTLGIEDSLEDFLAKKDRVFVYRLEPTDEPTPPRQRADLAWLWLVAMGLLVWLAF